MSLPVDRDVDGTPEVAALVVLSAFRQEWGHLVLASAIVAITRLLLVEKSRPHAMITRIDDAGSPPKPSLFGILSNTLMKLLFGAVIGRRRFRIPNPAWFAVMAIASAASIAVLR